MNAIVTDTGVPRGDLVLPRLLATILFALGAIFGLPALLVTVVAPFSGEWRPALVASAFLPGAWGLVWLGRVLWSGRPIPLWFINGFGITFLALSTLWMAFSGKWWPDLGFFATMAPMLLAIRASVRPGGKKPPGFHDLDELA